GAAADLGDLLGLDLVPLAQPQRAVHVRLRDGAARVGLEGQLQELPGAPERAEQLVQTRGVVAAREGLVEAVGALEDRFRPREAGPREQRSHHTRMGGPAWMQPLGPRAVRQVLDDPACLASADPERRDELVFREPAEPARDGGRREAPREGGRVIVAGGAATGAWQPQPAQLL